MSCPRCGATDRQDYHTRFPGDAVQPKEPAHWECQHCDRCYSDDEAGVAGEIKDEVMTPLPPGQYY